MQAGLCMKPDQLYNLYNMMCLFGRARIAHTRRFTKTKYTQNVTYINPAPNQPRPAKRCAFFSWTTSGGASAGRGPAAMMCADTPTHNNNNWQKRIDLNSLCVCGCERTRILLVECAQWLDRELFRWTHTRTRKRASMCIRYFVLHCILCVCVCR